MALGTDFHRRRLQVKSSQVSRLRGELTPRWDKRRRFALVMELLEELQPKRYITHRLSLSEAAQAFHLLENEETLQIVLDPRQDPTKDRKET